MTTEPAHDRLLSLLKRIPAIDHRIGSGIFANGLWWVKFTIDIKHPPAWRIVQEFGHILNLISADEHLPSVFKPVSPPVYLNGGPEIYLSWVIESTDKAFTPDICQEWLEGRLPRPVEDLSQWKLDEDLES